MKLRLLPLLLFIGVVGILWLLSARRADGAEGPWEVVMPQTPGKHCIGLNGAVYCDPSDPIEATFKGFKFLPCPSNESCQDFVDAMNEAHERRTNPGGFMVVPFHTNDPGSGLRPEK